MRKLKPSPINLHHFQRKARGNSFGSKNVLFMEKPLGSGPQLICFVILVKRWRLYGLQYILCPLSKTEQLVRATPRAWRLVLKQLHGVITVTVHFPTITVTEPQRSKSVINFRHNGYSRFFHSWVSVLMFTRNISDINWRFMQISTFNKMKNICWSSDINVHYARDIWEIENACFVCFVLFICHLAVVNKEEDKYLKMSLLSLSEFFSK